MSNPKAAGYRSGIVLLLISAVVFSTAGVFTKGVTADAWSVIFWRGLFAAGFTSLYIVTTRKAQAEFHRMGKPGLAIVLVSAAGTVAFIPAFKFTSIANVTLIYAAAPFVAASMAWLWFREKPASGVMWCSLVAILGVIIIFSGSIDQVTHDSLIGDALALWMTLSMALVFVIYRRYPSAPAAGPAVLASLLLCPLSLFFGDPFSESLHEILIMALFGIVFAIASVTLAEGARRIPPAEASLVSNLEIPLAPLWALLLFTEIPPLQTITGGVIIVIAILLSRI